MNQKRLDPARRGVERGEPAQVGHQLGLGHRRERIALDADDRSGHSAEGDADERRTEYGGVGVEYLLDRRGK